MVHKCESVQTLWAYMSVFVCVFDCACLCVCVFVWVTLYCSILMCLFAFVYVCGCVFVRICVDVCMIVCGCMGLMSVCVLTYISTEDWKQSLWLLRHAHLCLILISFQNSGSICHPHHNSVFVLKTGWLAGWLVPVLSEKLNRAPSSGVFCNCPSRFEFYGFETSVVVFSGPYSHECYISLMSTAHRCMDCDPLVRTDLVDKFMQCEEYKTNMHEK